MENQSNQNNSHHLFARIKKLTQIKTENQELKSYFKEKVFEPLRIRGTVIITTVSDVVQGIFREI